MCDEDSGFGTHDGFFPILGHSAALSEPGEGALHDPTSRQNLEPLCRIGALDDLDGPAPDIDQGVAPALEIVSLRGNRRGILRQKRPCTARCDTVLDRVPNIAQLNLAQLNLAREAKSSAAGQNKWIEFMIRDRLPRSGPMILPTRLRKTLVPVGLED
jgi:hypothetical protein